MDNWSDWIKVGTRGELLWANENPTEDFPSQVITPTFPSANSNIRDYKFIIIMGRASVTDETIIYGCSVLDNRLLDYNPTNIQSIYLGGGWDYRKLNFDSKGDIFISPAYDGNNNITSDAYAIPTRIIGYRDVITDI